MRSRCRIMFWPFSASRRHTSGFNNLIPRRSKVRCPLISPFMEKPVRPSGNQPGKAPNTWTGFMFNTTYSTCNERQGTEKRNWRIVCFFCKRKILVSFAFWHIFMAELLCYIIIHSPLQCRDHTGVRAARLPAMWVQPQVWFTRDDQREELRSVAWFSLKDEQRSGTDGFSRWPPWEFESACWLRRRRSPRTSCGWLIWLVVVTCFFKVPAVFQTVSKGLLLWSLSGHQVLIQTSVYFIFKARKTRHIRCKSCGTFTFYFHQGGYLCRERFSNSELTPSVVGNNNNLVQMFARTSPSWHGGWR